MLHVITGPPVSGKTTYLQQHAQPGDIRIDLDAIANHLSGLPESGHSYPGHALAIARSARAAAIDTALKHSYKHDVWIIDSKPTPRNQARYKEHGAKIINLDPGQDVVTRRAKQHRTPHTIKAIHAWYAPTPTVKIITAAHKNKPHGDLLIETSHLPNPHQEPSLRPRTGRSDRVQNWLLRQPGVTEFLQAQLDHIQQHQPSTIVITCVAGRHRSVAIAERLAHHLNHNGTDVELVHTVIDKPKAPKLTMEQRGYGLTHQRQREIMKRRHKDGTPCWWCGLPMHLDQQRNWDKWPLHADHGEAPGRDGGKASRFLHGKCNSQRRDGEHDGIRPALTGKHPSEPLPTSYNLARSGRGEAKDPQGGFNFGGITFN